MAKITLNILRNIIIKNRATPDFSRYKDMESDFLDHYNQCKDFTMLSIERLYALHKASEYISIFKIAGEIVECGCWKGGSAMLILLTLLNTGCSSKKIYLYDTFTGMTKPSIEDISISGKRAIDKWNSTNIELNNKWCFSPLDDVRQNIESTGYPKEKTVFIKGKVEDTIPHKIPKYISLLHLDTDWYESTKHELIHLFPRLSRNGVLVIDDYGHWQGVRKAVDEYFRKNKIKILLTRTDYTGRIGIKL